GAAEIARDKGYTRYFLHNLGYQVAPGKVFVLPRFQQMIARNLSRYGVTDYPVIGQIEAYIDSIGGYPCFIKPNEESQGKGVYKCYDTADVYAALDEYQRENFHTLLVEQFIPYVDYRVVIFDGKMIACYLRRPLTLTGDGMTPIRALLAAKQQTLEAQQRPVVINPDDPRIIARLQRLGLTMDSIPAAGAAIQIYDLSNLSIGGEAEDFTTRIHPRWRDLCIEITRQMGLRLCGVDFACANIEDPDAAYSIIETNSAPGMDNYAMLGEAQAQIVRDLYRQIFNEPRRLP
ncbi:MAG: hypothetical protein H7X77_09640, partial [Anaerolineae bacterium]|nr:hypothetical protein [Anaerolineae bacterium]